MNDIFTAQRFAGIRIIETPYVLPTPRMQLSEAVPVTDEVRVSMNAWMREFFGVEYRAIFIADTLFVNPAQGAELRAALRRIDEGMKAATSDREVIDGMLKSVDLIRRAIGE